MTGRIRHAQLGRYIDLFIIVGYIIAVAALLSLFPQLPIAVRIVLSLPLVVFIPGYTVLAILSPETHIQSQTQSDGLFERHDVSDQLVNLERLVLAIILSIAVVPLVTYAIALLAEITFNTVLFANTSVTLILSLAAGLRRRNVSITSDWQSATSTLRLNQLNSQSPLEVLPVLATIVALLLIVTSGAIAVTEVRTETPNTELSLLTESENGNLSADNYQQSFDTNDEAEYIVSIEHYKDEPQQYTVVVAIEEVRVEGGERAVESITELDRFTAMVEPNEQVLEPIRVSPPPTDRNASLTVLLYTGNPPANVNRDNALRAVHIPIEVTPD